MNLAVEPSTGEQVAALLRQIYATPKAVVERAAPPARGVDRRRDRARQDRLLGLDLILEQQPGLT